MFKALELAKMAAQQNEVPVGCVIVKDGVIIASSHNTTIADINPTAHAEINCIKQATSFLKTLFLNDCEMYVTLEPCPMCAQAISHARIKKLFFGAYDPKSGGVFHNTKTFHHRSAHHKPEIVGGVLENECSVLLKNFFHSRR